MGERCARSPRLRPRLLEGYVTGCGRAASHCTGVAMRQPRGTKDGAYALRRLGEVLGTAQCRPAAGASAGAFRPGILESAAAVRRGVKEQPWLTVGGARGEENLIASLVPYVPAVVLVHGASVGQLAEARAWARVTAEEASGPSGAPAPRSLFPNESVRTCSWCGYAGDGRPRRATGSLAHLLDGEGRMPQLWTVKGPRAVSAA
jgi:hypothetical protein